MRVILVQGLPILKYLIFADDDGIFNESCIEEILKVYNSNVKIDAVAGKIELLWDKKPQEWITPYEFMLGKLDYGNEVIVGTNLYLNGGLFSIKKSVFNQLRGFNPDLKGDFLVGDGDTGLVKKLRNNNHLIGWTPYAVMHHMQFVDKQGTEKDIGRRFYNVGISTAYSIFKDNHLKFTSAIFNYIFKTICFWIKKFIEYNILGNKHHKIFFSLMQRKGELSFFIHLRIKEVRQMIKADNILLG